jgi:hypothetical protein
MCTGPLTAYASEVQVQVTNCPDGSLVREGMGWQAGKGGAGVCRLQASRKVPVVFVNPSL